MLPFFPHDEMPEPEFTEFKGAAEALIKALQQRSGRGSRDELVLGLLQAILRSPQADHTGGLLCTISKDGKEVRRNGFGITTTEALFHLGMWQFEARLRTVEDSISLAAQQLPGLN